MLIEYVQAAVAGVGGITGAAWLGVRLVAPHIVKMREAKSDVFRAKAEAERARAEAQRIEAEHRIAQTGIAAGALEAMSNGLELANRRLDECMNRHDRVERESKAREDACEKRYRDLEERINRLTPQPFPAAKG